MRKFSAFSTCFIQYVGYTSGDVYGIVSRHEPLKNRFRHRGVVLALTLAELQPRLLLEMDAYAEEVDTMIDAALDAPSGCWGAELSGEVCTPGFAPGQAHFKNKFCAAEHLLPRQMQPGGQCCFYQMHCGSRRTHVVSPSEL